MWSFSVLRRDIDCLVEAGMGRSVWPRLTSVLCSDLEKDKNKSFDARFFLFCKFSCWSCAHCAWPKTDSALYFCSEFKMHLQLIECCCVLCVQVGIWPTQPYLDIHLTSRPPGRAATQRPHWLEWFLVSITRLKKKKSACNWQNWKREHFEAPQLLKMLFLLNAQIKAIYIYLQTHFKLKFSHYDSSLCHVPVLTSIVGQAKR